MSDQDIAIRRDAEQSNNIVHWSDINAGGHFAASKHSTCWWPTCEPSSPGRVEVVPASLQKT